MGARSAASRSIPIRLGAARAFGVAGLAAYNWWLLILLGPGWRTSMNGFFSDLSARGQPHAASLQRLDTLAGGLLVVSLLLRGPVGADGTRRREWPWLVAFAVFGGIGGRYPYACASGLDHACRALERHFELPFEHYVHMASGIGEFVTITLAILLAHRRTRGDHTVEAGLFHGLVWVLVVAYPLLAVAYFGDRWGTLVEPIFFVSFTAVIVAELFESRGAPARPTGPTDRAHRTPGAAA